MRRPGVFVLGAVAAVLLAGCVGDTPALTEQGTALAVNVAALNLAGVGDVVWDVEVVNGASTPQVVWQRRFSSSSHGDGAGSASYVGTCDADPAARLNTVKVWVVGVYSEAVTALGTFASGALNGADGPSLAFENPTTTAPLTRQVSCQDNADVAVTFDVALMRPAQQGFFDVAVNFNNIFCSAKFDCCQDANDDGTCDGDIALLFEAGGGRGPTLVLGFACTAGPRADVETELFLDALTLDCTAPGDGYVADLVIDPSGPPGNQCTAGSDGMTACAPRVTALHGLDADTYLFQVGIYRGFEAITSGGVAAQKVYWNVALGVKRPAIAGCWLRTRGTADDALGTGAVDNGVVAAGAVYPVIAWDVPLGACAAEGLAFGDPSARVRTEYTATTGTGTAFAFGFGPHLSAGSLCTPACSNGGVCTAGGCDCSATEFQGANCTQPRPVEATGGAVATYVDAGTTYRVHTFTSSGTFTVTRAGVVDYLVVAGGGGGGGGYNHCGGGGAGGLITGAATVSATTYTVTVGAGGGGAVSGVGGHGAASAFGAFTTPGGGGGCASAYGTGAAGGSGGGGCALSGQGGAGVAGEGFQGGTGSSANLGAQDSGAGGGGGAGGLGTPQGAIGPFSNSPGIGGPAYVSSITGTATKYAAGGNGAGYYSSLPNEGIGGASPGTGIGDSPARVAATAGAANTGSGGGGGRAAQQVVATSATGAAGGSGVVILRYPIN